jgi:predicted phosphoribosyltransferase
MRDLLRSLLEARPQLQPALTAQFRDFAELSDEDVEGFLRQLDALGVLDEYLKDKR